MADGEFSGENSQSEQIGSGTINSGSGGRAINIYEIVAEQGNGYFGYLIGGCEPICPTVNDAFDKNKIDAYKARTQIYMDALCNLNPGTNDNKPYKFDHLDQEGVKHYGIKKDQEVEGYYEYVNEGGVYKYISATPESGAISNVIMKSKACGESGNYNFVWHYGKPDDSAKRIIKAEDISDMKSGNVIYLSKYRKNIYGNNESFLALFYSEGKENKESGETIKRLSAMINGIEQSVNGVNGIYYIENTDNREIKSEYSNNRKVIEEWKKSNTVNYFTRTPRQLSNEDIDNADLFIFNPGANYKDAVKIYNIMNETSHTGKTDYSKDNDITFEQALKIYDHVAIKQDAAIVMRKDNYSNLINNDMNIGKLQWLLYAPMADNDWHWGSGREVCSEILDWYNRNNQSQAYNDVKMSETSLTRSDGRSWEWWKVTDWNNDNGLYKMMLENMTGKYKTNVTGVSKDMSLGQYKNMMIIEANTQLTYSSQNANNFMYMLVDHVDAKHTSAASELFYLSMDILNGDSKSKVSGGVANAGNKVLYVNEYEMPPDNREPGRTYTEQIPIHIRIFSSHDIKNVKVYKNASVNPATKEVLKNDATKLLYDYSSESELNSLLPIKEAGIKKTVKNDSGTETEITVTKFEDAERDETSGDVIDGSVKINIPYTELKKPSPSRGYNRNTSIVVVVTNIGNKSVADSINIVYRSFFDLN